MTTEPAPLLCLVGPTACGKSAISLELAKYLPIEIINVDSATIYRGMDIGTAKPSASERAEVAHHLLDIRDPNQSYSAAAFRQDALACAAQIRSRGHVPVLVGGTMLYLHVLQQGIDDLPQASSELRQEIQTQAQDQGWPEMHAQLVRLDPKTAARLAPNDSQRIGRALEIFYASGTPMSALIGQRRLKGQALTLVSLEPSDRAALHQRIERRFDQMLDAGLLQEVEGLYARGDLHAGMPSVRCVGYRQIWAHLQGQCTLAQAREQAIAATRQLAKRQLTWLRSMPERHIIDCLAPQAREQALAQLTSALTAPPLT